MTLLKKAKVSALAYLPEERTITCLSQALAGCKGCDLCLNGTRAVFGMGKAHAALMLVGEQPGDVEEQRGSPFVGPAGAELDRILEDMHVPRDELYLTNAVKHFRFVQRGKRRLHETPRMSEVTACRPWLAAEIETVRPKVVLCLGANASKSLLGAGFSLMRDHGKIMHSIFAERVCTTIHPSAVLRAADAAERHALRDMLSADLGIAWRAANGDAT